MSSISVVKQTMTQATQAFNILESNINQLLRLLSSVTVASAYIVSDYTSTVSNSLSSARRVSERMYQLNGAELHILFSELNSKNREINEQLMLMTSDLNDLKMLAKNAYDDYKYYEAFEFLNDELYLILLDVTRLKAHIPKLEKLKTDLSMFKLIVDTNNRKLMVGVRK